jgi:carbonic anhydrase
MNRRPCIDMEQNSCKRLDPPKADYPRYSSHLTSFADMINYDIKIPGEHTIDGEVFDAEIQMLHMFPTASRVSSIGVLVRAEENGYNGEFQEIINEFQNLYDEHSRACSRRKRKRRNMLEDMLSGAFWNTGLEEASYNSTRYLRNGRFDPYSFALMPTIFFYRYDGSITEPPCKVSSI